MSWTLRLQGRMHMLLDSTEECPQGGRVLQPEAASERLAQLAANQANMPALRDAYTDGLGQPTSRTRSDFIVVAEVMAALREGQLRLAAKAPPKAYGFSPPPRGAAPPKERPETLHSEPEPEQQQVAAEQASAPPPAPQPADPAATAQAQALRQAAVNGDPFCDELVD